MMRDLSEYVYSFTKLRRAPNLGGAPHKPVLLLSVIDAIAQGYIKSERIYISAELIADHLSSMMRLSHNG